MLLRFRVANFRSILDPVELTLRMRPGPEQAHAARPLVALFGANASGKSNVLRALTFARSAALWSHSRWSPSQPPRRQPFLLQEEAFDSPSLFEVDVAINSERWQYGFTVGRDAIETEWLYTFPEGRRRMLFERELDEFSFGRGLRGGQNRAIADFVRSNSLFLSAAAVNNHEGILPLFRWFESITRGGLQAPENELTLELLDGDHRLDVERMLRLADLGICGVAVTEEQIDPKVANAVRGLFETLGTEIQAEAPLNISTQSSIELEHRTPDGGTVRLDLNEESRGTQMWFSHIGPVLTALRDGRVLLIDELDASLHPRLSSEILRLFSDPSTNPRGAQLLFSTHDASLLGRLVEGHLTRDDVWLTEKDARGVTSLYPLSDFRPRKREALERGYLQGRYGAVPIVDLTAVGELLEAESVSEPRG